MIIMAFVMMLGMFFSAGTAPHDATAYMGQMEHLQDKAKAETEVKSLTRTAEEAEVTVEVTYKNPGKEKPEFKVTLDTHSVPLERYDLVKNTVLRDEKGKEYASPDVIASESSGSHHRSAVLKFKDASAVTAKSVKLALKDLAGIKERVFIFDLQE